MVLPAYSGRAATLSARGEIGAESKCRPGMPSTWRRCRDVSKASSFDAVMTSSMSLVSRIDGTKPAPMP